MSEKIKSDKNIISILSLKKTCKREELVSRIERAVTKILTGIRISTIANVLNDNIYLNDLSLHEDGLVCELTRLLSGDNYNKLVHYIKYDNLDFTEESKPGLYTWPTSCKDVIFMLYTKTDLNQISNLLQLKNKTTSVLRKRLHRACTLLADYGAEAGVHHKMWCFDQILRILTQDTYNSCQEWRDNTHRFMEWNCGIVP